MSNTIKILAPVAGEVINLEDVNDPVFSQKKLGEGFAVKPSSGKIVSPVTGKVIMVAETKHALGLQTADGVEVMLHFGIDTVELDGKPFDLQVAANSEVKAGQQLGTMDLQAIKDAQKDDTVILAITNTADILAGIDLALGTKSAGESAATITLKQAKAAPAAANKNENKYQTTAREIVQAVGGTDNVKNVMHCFTRLRFTLNDNSIPNDDEVNNIKGVIDVTRANNQYQIVIGQTVEDVYDELIKLLGPEYAGQGEPAPAAPAPAANQSIGGKIKNGFFQLIGVITGSMMPVIGLLAASGMLKGILNILTNFCHMSTASPTYTIINAMGGCVVLLPAFNRWFYCCSKIRF